MKDSRLPLFLGLAILAMTGGGVALLGLPGGDVPERVMREGNVADGAVTEPSPGQARVAEESGTAPRVGTGAGGRAAEGVEPKAGAGKFIEPEFDVQAIPETPLVVDSFPPTRHLPLADWVKHQVNVGHFDGLYLLPGREALTPERSIDGNATLLASGWAGDPHLGMQMRDVLLTQCDRVVGRARVALARPDVADAVHPNLERSGWEAVIHAADLAVCGEPALNAWAVLPGYPAALLPLIGRHAVSPVSPLAQPDYHLSALPPLAPADVEPPKIGDVEVTASRVNLRRCGGLNCDRVSQIDGGRHRAFVAERRDGWSLIVFGDRSGWMSDSLYRAAK